MKTLDPLYQLLLPCGPWIEYSWPRRVWLTVRWWPWGVARGVWGAKYYVWRLVLHKLHLRHYLLESEEVDWDDYWLHHTDEEMADHLAYTQRYFGMTPGTVFLLAARRSQPRFLWYEERKQLEQRKAAGKLHYPVGWDGRRPWYTLW